MLIANNVFYLFIYEPTGDGPYDRNIHWLNEKIEMIKPLLLLLILTDFIKI
jgi:hypothetical protein